MTDWDNHLSGQLAISYRNLNHGCTKLNLWNIMESGGKQTKFKLPILDCASNAKALQEWHESLAKSKKPYELGLHKRGRQYHVSLGWDGNRQYETKPLSSLRLPGKELVIVASVWDKDRGGQMQATIDSIEITRVSK